MNFSLPDIDVRNLISENEKAKILIEKDFDNNYKIFANCIAYGIANDGLNYVENRLKDKYFCIAPTEQMLSCASLDITKNANFGFIKKCIAPFENLPPFDEWMNTFPKNDLTGGSASYFQGLMERVALVAEEKLNEILKLYTTNPKRSNLNFKVEFKKEGLELCVTFSINSTKIDPLPSTKEITISKKAIPVAKKTDIKENSFDPFFDDF